MGDLTVLTLRIVLAMLLAGSLFVQGVMVPLCRDLTSWTPTTPTLRTPS